LPGGSVDVGVLSYKKYDSMVAAGDIKAEDAPIIWVTPDYADYNLTAHPALEEIFGERFHRQVAEGVGRLH
jgi:phosphonate transport system substrate-binding protein